MADPRRSPPPGWKVERHGSLPSMQTWKGYNADYGWTIPWRLRREAVADCWAIHDKTAPTT
jgi:hypothetical protein